MARIPRGMNRGTLRVGERRPKYFLWDVITKSIEGYDTNYLALRSRATSQGGMILRAKDFNRYAKREIEKYGELGGYGKAFGKKLGLIDPSKDTVKMEDIVGE